MSIRGMGSNIISQLPDAFLLPTGEGDHSRYHGLPRSAETRQLILRMKVCTKLVRKGGLTLLQRGRTVPQERCGQRVPGRRRPWFDPQETSSVAEHFRMSDFGDKTSRFAESGKGAQESSSVQNTSL